MRPRRVAAIDCGTNSVRLLVAEYDGGPAAVSPAGTPRDVVRRLVINRLGEGVDRTGRISVAALERTARVFDSYAADVAAAGVAGIRVVATSATRDAANRGEFVALVRRAFGVDPDVVPGEEEAALSYLGAVRSLPSVPGPVLVCDIGGGSTELIRGSGGRTASSVDAAYSMDVGCVRLTERHLTADPPSPESIEAAAADVRSVLADAEAHGVATTGHATFLGLAGSVTTIAALALGLREYRELDVHGVRITRSQVAGAADWLLAATHAERAARPVIHEGRVDVIAAGALVLHEVLGRTGTDSVLVSEHDVLDGIAWSVADRLWP